MLRSLTQTLRGQILILTALFVCSLPLVTPRIYASDEVQYFAYLRSLWFDRDVSFENEYQHFYDAGIVKNPDFHETFLERMTDTGRRNTFATMGSALLWSPFYAVADVIVRVRGESDRGANSETSGDAGGSADAGRVRTGSASSSGASSSGVGNSAVGSSGSETIGSAGSGGAGSSSGKIDSQPTIGSGGSGNSGGYSAPYIAAVAYGSAVYGWLSLVLSLFITRRVIGTSAGSLAAVIAVWIGTPLFFYMYIAPPMAHACSAFAVSAFVLVWLRIRGAWSVRGMLALGALAALMAMVREQDVFIAIGPAVDFAVDVWRARGGGDRVRALPLILRGLAGAAGFAIAYTPQLIAYRAINGYFGPSRLVARKLNWMAPHAIGVLMSPEHGLLFWTPLVLLSLAGLAWLAVRPHPTPDGGRIGVCLLLMVLSQIYIAGSVESWTVAGAFGQRRFVGLTSIFVTGLAIVLSRVSIARARASMPTAAPARVSRIACAAAVALGVWWNLGLMAQFGAGLMDRQRLELGRNAYQTFVTIPGRVPDLAYRYLFARGSFYKPAEPPREQ